MRNGFKLMTIIDWYFDFISPYSYFGSLQIESLGEHVQLNYCPVLFAALLNHWGQKGPAEIEAKRKWTYRWCTWWAQENNIPFRMPAAHPFNPIPYLRLAIAADCAPKAVQTIFNTLWTTGADPSDPQLLSVLLQRLDVDPARLREQTIKDALRQQTDRAISHGVFGVPSLHINEQLFWGADALDFVKAYLTNPALLDTAELLRVSTLPVGAARKPS